MRNWPGLASPGAAAHLWGSRTHVLQRVVEYHSEPPGLTAKRPHKSSIFCGRVSFVRPVPNSWTGSARSRCVYRCNWRQFSSGTLSRSARFPGFRSLKQRLKRELVREHVLDVEWNQFLHDQQRNATFRCGTLPPGDSLTVPTGSRPIKSGQKSGQGATDGRATLDPLVSNLSHCGRSALKRRQDLNIASGAVGRRDAVFR